MNFWKTLAIFFALFSISGLSETHRIFTSNEADIAENRSILIPMALILNILFIWASIYFWKRSTKNKLL